MSVAIGLTAFQCLQQIARSLNDKDLAAFRVVCQDTCGAIDARPEHFWMYRYLDNFDRPLAFRNLNQFRTAYEKTRSILRSPPIFRHNKTNAESECLEIIRQLIVGKLSFPSVSALLAACTKPTSPLKY